MRRLAALIAILFLTHVVGCQSNPLANNPISMQGKVTALEQQQIALTQRNQELQTRAASLDRDNQELETMLAQSRQQTRVYEDQVAALRDQLGGATAQLAKLRTDYDSTSKRVETMTVSAKRRAEATITPNNSFEASASAIQIPGVETRVDGDVIRIELPGRMFEHGSARLLPEATPLIDQVAAELMRAYPSQIVGVEGHTDSDPVAVGSKWTSNHQLSIGRAMAVYDHLVSRDRVPANHLFVVGHGSNHPVVSNGTEAGKQRNRRVELVIYPDRAAGR
ncbi:MAG TPA: OmpA family protein [Pirellulales bacterium]|nr:OmpA family protein [Pirellulales bacterium]